MSARPIQIAGLCAALLAGPAAASADPQLLSTTPPARARASAPARLELHFSEALDGSLSGARLVTLKVWMPFGMEAFRRNIEAISGLDPHDPKTLIVTPDAPLKPGVYRLSWKAAGLDRRRAAGEYDFTVR